MARPPKRPPETHATVDAKTSGADEHHDQQLVLANDTKVGELVRRFELPVELQTYDRQAYIFQIQSLVQAHALSGIRIGQLFWLILQREGAAGFKDAVARVGCGDAYAKRLVRVAQLVNSSDDIARLSADLPVSKLLLLEQNLSQDEIERIAIDADDAVITRDDLRLKSRNDLIEMLRERDEDRVAQEEIIARKDKKINDLEKRHRALNRAPLRDQVEEKLVLLDELIVEHLSVAHKIETLMSDVKAAYKDAGQRMDADVDERLEQGATSMQSQIARVCKLAGV